MPPRRRRLRRLRADQPRQYERQIQAELAAVRAKAVIVAADEDHAHVARAAGALGIAVLALRRSPGECGVFGLDGPELPLGYYAVLEEGARRGFDALSPVRGSGLRMTANAAGGLLLSLALRMRATYLLPSLALRMRATYAGAVVLSELRHDQVHASHIAAG